MKAIQDPGHFIFTFRFEQLQERIGTQKGINTTWFDRREI